jgi:hypothetical protein
MWKTCNCCNINWEDNRKFLADPCIKYVGIQILPDLPGFSCVFFFDHVTCGSTLILDIHKLKDMIDEPIPELTMAGEKNCPLYCKDPKIFLECENECHNAPFRRLAIRVLKNINKLS